MKVPLLSSVFRRPGRALLILAGLGAVAALAIPAHAATVNAADKRAATVNAADKRAATVNVADKHTTTTRNAATGPADQDTAVLATPADPKARIPVSRHGKPKRVTPPPVQAGSGDNTVLGIGESSRNVQFHNATARTVSVAVLVYNPKKCGGEWGDWEAAGWYNIAPGDTRYILKTSNRYIAYYAASTDGRYVWPAQNRTGTPVSVPGNAAFDNCLNLESLDWDVIWMKQLKVGSGSTPFTMHLTPPS
jgi:hypothetical protein